MLVLTIKPFSQYIISADGNFARESSQGTADKMSEVFELSLPQWSNCKYRKKANS